MPDLLQFRQLIEERMRELGARVNDIEADLDTPNAKDLEDLSIDLENDEVLENLGLAAQRELTLLQRAIVRVERGDYGICKDCESEISNARLAAVPYAVLCRNCAADKAL